MKRNRTAIALLVAAAIAAIPRPAGAQEEDNASPAIAVANPSPTSQTRHPDGKHDAPPPAAKADVAEPNAGRPDPAARTDPSDETSTKPDPIQPSPAPTETSGPNPNSIGEMQSAAATPVLGPTTTTTPATPLPGRKEETKPAPVAQVPGPTTTTMPAPPRMGWKEETGSNRPRLPSWNTHPYPNTPQDSSSSVDFAGWIGVGLSAVVIAGLAGILFLLVRRVPARKDVKDLDESIKREIVEAVKPYFDKVTDLDLKTRFDTLGRAVSTIGSKIEKQSAVAGEQTRKTETTWSGFKSFFGGKVDEGQKSLSAAVAKLDDMQKQLQDAQRRIADQSAACARREADADHKAADAARALADVEARVQNAIRETQSRTREEDRRLSDARDRELETLKTNVLKAAQEKERDVREELQTLVRELGQTKLELGTFRERVVNDDKAHQAALAAKESEAAAEIAAIRKELDDTRASFESRLSTERLKLEKAVADENETKIKALRSEADEARKRLSDAEGRHAEEVAGYRKKVEDALNAKAKAEAEGKAALDAVSAELDKAKSNLEKAIASAEAERTEAASRLAKQREETEAALADGAALRARLYPAEFSEAAAFGPLRDSLEDWDARKVPGAEIVKAGLGLFANRALVEPEVWRSALRDISIGLATVSAKEGRKPAETVAEMARWAKFLSGLSTPAARFTLKIPEIGSQVDVGWMDCKSRSVTVRNVSSWAVYGDMGVAYQAKVD